jgi:hypothetical protein
MSPTFDPDRFGVTHDTARSVGKLLFGAVATLFVLALATFLPGVDRVIPGTRVPFGALVQAVASIVVAALLVYAASGLATIVAVSIDRSRDVVESAASLAYWLVVLCAVLVVHWGLGPLMGALFADVRWVYDTVFLLATLWPLLVITARLYVVMDPLAERFANKIASDSASSRE